MTNWRRPRLPHRPSPPPLLSPPTSSRWPNSSVSGRSRDDPHDWRAITIPCAAFHPQRDLATHPSREALRRLLAAAPRLEVWLAMAATIEQWRNRCLYQTHASTASQRDQMDEQWRNLQRMGAELPRVTVIVA